MALFESVTGITDYINMVISTWLGLYLTTRVRANRVAFRVVVIMLALGGYYFVKIMNTGLARPSLTGQDLLILLALIAAENLTFSMMPQNLQQKQAWQTRIIIVLGVFAMVMQIAFTPQTGGSVGMIAVPDLFSPGGIVGIFEVIASLAILKNLYVIWRSGMLEINREFVAGMAIGAGTIGYALVGFLLQVELPRFVASIMLFVSLLLLIYSFGKHQIFLERRILRSDLPLSILSLIGLIAIYLFAAGGDLLTPTRLATITILVIASHVYYGWLRERFQRELNRSSGRYTRLIQKMAQRSAIAETPDRNLQRGLVLLTDHVQARTAFLAVLQGEQFVVETSVDSLETGSVIQISPEEISHPMPSSGRIRGKIAWLIPGYHGEKTQVILGLGPRKGLRDYTTADLDWLQVVANHFGTAISALKNREDHDQPALDGPPGRAGFPEVERLMDAVSLRPPPEMVKSVEQGFKYLNDVIRLGRSPLVEELGVEGDTHIERGKQLKSRLMEVLETLRPEGELPKEPIPAEWRKYVILHDAYVTQDQHRNIMGKLYISDSTFYRDRRDAIHGVASALFERMALG